MKKRVIAVFLTMVLVAALSTAVLAGNATGSVATGVRGQNVTININLTNNPGIAGAIFNVTYDSNVMTPVKVDNGDAGFDLVVGNLETPGEVTIVALDEQGENVENDGKAVSVAFKIADDAELNTYEIGISCEAGNVANEDMEEVTLYTASGSIEVLDCVVGDLDGDGEVTDGDAIYLMYYTFFQEDYPLNQECDYDGDGEVTDGDAIYLMYHTFFQEDYPLS